MTTTIDAAEAALQDRLINQIRADLDRLPHLDPSVDAAIATELSAIHHGIRSSVCDALSLLQLENLSAECSTRAEGASEPERSHLNFIKDVCDGYLEDAAA